MIKLKQILGKSDRFTTQLLRYLVVGGIAFVADFLTMVGLTERFGWHYAWSGAAGFGVGLTTNYLLSVLWVFSSRNIRNWRIEFLLFSLVGIVGLGLTELILWSGTEWFGMDYRLSKLVAVALVLAWNFLARKALLFRNQPLPNDSATPVSLEGNI